MKKTSLIAIASDHAGYDLKEYIKNYLISLDYEIKDFGTNNSESMDYPDVIHPLCESIKKSSYDFGIILCGSGNGVNITANKHTGIRSALCWKPELAKLARNHNNANILALPARFLTDIEAKEIVKEFLQSEFEGGRHIRRVEKIEL